MEELFLLIHSWFSGFSPKGTIMAVKLIYMDSCQTSWKNKTNHSRALLRGEWGAGDRNSPLWSHCAPESALSAAGQASCSVSFPSLPLIFQHFAWDTWKLFSRHLDCMAASGSLVFTELVNWHFLNKILTSVVDMLYSDKSPGCMPWSGFLF